MSERPKPYVGVSGIISPEQQELFRLVTMPLHEEGYRLALGVKAVHKTQWLDVENKYGTDWYPIGPSICDVLATGNDEHELRVAQVFLDTESAKKERESDYEIRFINKLLGRTATWLSAVQFDMLAWHANDYRYLFERIRSKNRDTEIILQCHRLQMAQLGAKEALRKIDKYNGYVDHILFDASHGTGAEMSAYSLLPFVSEAAERDWLGVGVAGGLDGRTVTDNLPTLLAEFSELSFDAEGKLHVHADKGKKVLNDAVTLHYLNSARDVLSHRT